jgi:hypothetical protein
VDNSWRMFFDFVERLLNSKAYGDRPSRFWNRPTCEHYQEICQDLFFLNHPPFNAIFGELAHGTLDERCRTGSLSVQTEPADNSDLRAGSSIGPVTYGMLGELIHNVARSDGQIWDIYSPACRIYENRKSAHRTSIYEYTPSLFSAQLT